MARYINTIPQKPRSRHFKQYDSSQGRIAQISTSKTIESKSEQQDEINIQETYSQLPSPPDYGVLGIVTDTNRFYLWDSDTATWVNQTVDTGVTQIIQGSNITISPSTGKGAVTVNSTAGNITLATSGTGNSVSSLSLSGNTLTQNMGDKLNSVTESPDSTQGVYFVSANQSPSYNNGVLNLPYKSLEQGTNVNFTYNGSQVVINATGGSSSTANVQDVSSGIGTSILKMYRYTYTVSQQITLSGYGNQTSYIGTIPFTPLNIISSMTIPGNVIQQLPVSTYVLSQGQTGNTLIIQNCNSQSITIPQNTYFSVLFFGI